jgi:protein-S-isoprenylcysteine O-methyltransferase Ste14
MATIIELAVASVAALGALRGIVVLVKGARSIAERERFTTVRLGPGDLITAPEPFLILVASVWLFVHRSDLDPSAANLVVALAALAIAVAGWDVIVWTIRSWPKIHVGHGWRDDQELVTSGIYAFVRHPVYLGAFLVWAGIVVASLNWIWAVLFVGYVVPAYVIYSRAEERMMEQELGDRYRHYKRLVPGFVPRIGRQPYSDTA